MSATCVWFNNNVILSYRAKWPNYEIDIWLSFRSYCLVIFYSTEQCLTWWLKPRELSEAPTGGIIVIMMKSKNSRKNKPRASADYGKWLRKMENSPNPISRSRVHPSSRGPFKGVSIQTMGPTTTMTWCRVCAAQAVILSQPLLSQGTAANDADVRGRIHDDTKPTSCASSARQFPSLFPCLPGFSFSSRYRSVRDSRGI